MHKYGGQDIVEKSGEEVKHKRRKKKRESRKRKEDAEKKIKIN
jgi:hypothetical protein